MYIYIVYAQKLATSQHLYMNAFILYLQTRLSRLLSLTELQWYGLRGDKGSQLRSKF
jgi:hypothetical protein